MAVEKCARKEVTCVTIVHVYWICNLLMTATLYADAGNSLDALVTSLALVGLILNASQPARIVNASGAS